MCEFDLMPPTSFAPWQVPHAWGVCESAMAQEA